MLLVPLVLFASAEPAPVECAPPEVWATTPPPLATDVPVDAVPAGLITKGSCGGSVYALVYVPATGEQDYSVEDVGGDLVVEVDSGEDLLPNTTYALTFETDGGEPTQIGFTTGTGRVVGLDGPPSVASAIVSIANDGTTQVQAEVDVASAAEGESIVLLGLRGVEDPIDATLSGPARVQLAGFTWLDGAPEEVCVVARQRDLAGNWTESEPNCVAPDLEPPEKGGCFASNREDAPLTRGAAALGLLLLGFRRRRR